MKVLVATTPGWGHVSPVLPVAEELARRGHQILWATASDAAGRLAAIGFDVVAVGRPLAERLPLAARMLEERAAGVPPSLRRAHAFTVHFASLGAFGPSDDVRGLAATYRPDVVVREPCELASALVARTLDVPLVTVGFGGIVPERARHLADETLAAVRADWRVPGSSDDWHFGDLYLHPMPASLDTEAAPAVARRVRPEWSSAPSSRPSSRSVELDRFGRSRPGVYATFGTEFGPIAPWQPLLEALGALDVDALVTTGSSGLPASALVQPNVIVEEYVAQGEVLGRASVVVSHAGSGTLLGAAAAGVPQVCIPLGADQFENAAAAAARGIAEVVDPTSRTPSGIADAIRHALTAPAMSAAASALAAELAEAASLGRASDWIEALEAAASRR